jgi:hypothetical protein
MTRFEHILKEIPTTEDLSVFLRLIYNYYLNDQDKENYTILIMYIHGKPQKELGILLGMQQFKVSKRLAKLRNKIRNIGTLFRNNRDELLELMQYIRENFNNRTYLTISYLLAGNKYYTIADHFKCLPGSVFYMMHAVEKKLPVEYLPLFKQCIDYLT